MSKKLTLKNIEEIRNNGNSLTQYVCDYIMDEWNDYDDKMDIMQDVLTQGCISGIVSSLIYYNDTTAFYQDHKEEINNLLYETMDEIGEYSPKAIFGEKWNEKDPLAIGVGNQNLLAWFGFEETMRKIMYEFDVEF